MVVSILFAYVMLLYVLFLCLYKMLDGSNIKNNAQKTNLQKSGVANMEQ